ncbi:MAG TPA: trypsin-like peptidase domain-containing protein [Planctomycetota bacterium]|nr:trypsin-like peptidase domain-containing protein [Planctomycetota bacterium]
MRAIARAAAAASRGLGGAALLGAILLGGIPLRTARADEPAKTEERRTTTLAGAFADVAQKVAPSVVEVRTLSGDDLGFGVAIDDGTYVLTSRDVAEAAPNGQVQLHRGGGATEWTAPASVAGSNEAYDVALLKVEARGAKLEPLPLGSSSKLAIGQWVVTVGTGGDRPVGVGVVSALRRRVEPHATAPAVDLFGLFSENGGPKRAYARVIQHDSPVDGEKAGTPLVDADGKLVGINLANPYRGSCYAAPIDDVAPFLDDLKAGKAGPPEPKPGYMGVVLGSASDPEVPKKLGIVGPGIEIHGVTKGFPAEKAGVKKGDIVLAVDGEKVRSTNRFGTIIAGHLAGEKVTVRVLREGKELDLPVVLTERPAENE